MKNLEKQIEEAAKNNCNLLGGGEEDDYSYNHVLDAFYNGVKSPEAKEYWQQGMYSTVQLVDLADFICEKLNKGSLRNELITLWIEQNKKK